MDWNSLAVSLPVPGWTELNRTDGRTIRLWSFLRRGVIIMLSISHPLFAITLQHINCTHFDCRLLH